MKSSELSPQFYPDYSSWVVDAVRREAFYPALQSRDPESGPLPILLPLPLPDVQSVSFQRAPRCPSMRTRRSSPMHAPEAEAEAVSGAGQIALDSSPIGTLSA